MSQTMSQLPSEHAMSLADFDLLTQKDLFSDYRFLQASQSVGEPANSVYV